MPLAITHFENDDIFVGMTNVTSRAAASDKSGGFLTESCVNDMTNVFANGPFAKG